MDIEERIKNDFNNFLDDLSTHKANFPIYIDRVLEDYKRNFEKIELTKCNSLIDFRKKLLCGDTENDRNYFTISSKKSFSNLIKNGSSDSWGKSIVYTPLNDHSREYLKKGDVLFCYRQGQFSDLDEALNKRGIYGIGVATTDPVKLFPDKNKHNQWAVHVSFPLPLKRHLKLRNIQMHPVTIDLTPYNGNRNDALQYISETKYIDTLLNMIYSSNPEITNEIRGFFKNKKLTKKSMPEDILKSKYKISKPIFSHDSSKNISSLISDCLESLSAIDLVFSKQLISRFAISLLSKRFTILTGLSGSGKSQLAISFAKWITEPKNNYSLLSSALNDEVIKNNYDLVNYSKDTVELINRSGTSGKIIPLPVNLIFEWFTEIVQGNLTEKEDPKDFKDKIDKRSTYQKYMQGFYNDLSKIAFTMKKYHDEPLSLSNNQFEIIPVGADWTNREPLFGYPNALEEGKYVLPESGVLQLVLNAKKDPERPYFLILDEMNLSHVERYFADFLSAIESGEEIKLHSGEKSWEADGYQIPSSLSIPENLFIIGTVNIDETTYMFSPKVLDRANVIEFRVSKNEMATFLENPADVDLSELEGEGAGMAKGFVKMATNPAAEFSDKETLSKELIQFFENLSEVGAEFGYRTANEINRFASISEQLAEDWEFEQIVDAAISQKLLPKLHGSRRKLEGTLIKLGNLCHPDLEKGCEELFKQPEIISAETYQEARYPISFEKIVRMQKGLIQNGFTSFAEA